MDQLKKFYKNKKVFITGHTGFKGSWLTSVLLKYGAKVIGYSQNDSKKKNYEMFVNYKKVKNIYANILDFKKLKQSVQRYKPSIIFHLAAQPLVSESYINPLKTFKTNMVGSINVMEATRFCSSIKSLVMITSDKCYHNKEIKRGYKEEDILGGDDPYSASKAAAEIAYNSFNRSFFYKNKKIGVASARAGNVIGGGDWSKDRLIPDCVKSWSKKKRVILRNPKSTRPWQHVLEAVYGYLLLAQNLKKNKKLHGEVFNFGPSNNKNYNVLYLVKLMKNSWKNVFWKVNKYNKKSFFESNLLKLNCNKAKSILKWRCILNFKETINMVTNWYKDYYLKPQKIYLTTTNQIKNYEKLLTEREIK